MLGSPLNRDGRMTVFAGQAVQSSGYRVVPELVELWQGQPSRLHDRVRYRRAGTAWLRERLAP